MPTSLSPERARQLKITFGQAIQCGPIDNGALVRFARVTVEHADQINAALERLAVLEARMEQAKSTCARIMDLNSVSGWTSDAIHVAVLLASILKGDDQ